jgi:hypothetical protein
VLIRSDILTTCKVCAKEFVRSNTFRSACSWACVNKFANQAEQAAKKAAREARKAEAAAERAEREGDKARREALKTRQDWIGDAQDAFNLFIRTRDANETCICCGRWPAPDDFKPGGVWDAGHFLGRGAYPELRFDEDNCHKQLKSCNAGSTKYAAKGRTVAQGYRLRLIGKIGLERVERLEGPHPQRKYTVAELREIITTYRAKARALTKDQQ